MLTGFDTLTGFQICMVIFLSVFSFRYRKHCSENLAYFLPVPVLYILWACVVIYYFADFFFHGCPLVSAGKFSQCRNRRAVEKKNATLLSRTGRGRILLSLCRLYVSVLIGHCDSSGRNPVSGILYAPSGTFVGI